MARRTPRPHLLLAHLFRHDDDAAVPLDSGGQSQTDACGGRGTRTTGEHARTHTHTMFQARREAAAGVQPAVPGQGRVFTGEEGRQGRRKAGTQVRGPVFPDVGSMMV